MPQPDETTLFQSPEVPPEATASTHERRCIEVSDDPGLSYALPVPRPMYSSTAIQSRPTSIMQPTLIGVFGLDRALKGPRLIASAQTLPWEVDPLEWLRYAWIHSGWRVVVARRVINDLGMRYELGAIKTTAGQTTVRRTLATRSGARLVRLDAAAPVAQWGAWHDRFWVALDGFSPVAANNGGIEALACKSGPLLRFAVPASWAARGRGDIAAGVHWRAVPTRGVGKPSLLRVQAHCGGAPTDPAERRARLVAQLHDEGFALLHPLRRVEREDFRELLPGWQGQWTTELQHERGAVQLVLAQRDEAGVVVDYALLTPPPGAEHVDWMRATRALDIAQSTTTVRAPLPAA